MKEFIDQHRDVYGVEPIGKVLPIAPTTYDLQVARESDPANRPEPSVMSVCAGKSNRSGTRMCRPTVLTRLGGHCGAKAWRWPAARWSGGYGGSV